MTEQTRRQFLRWVGLGAVAAVAPKGLLDLTLREPTFTAVMRPIRQPFYDGFVCEGGTWTWFYGQHAPIFKVSMADIPQGPSFPQRLVMRAKGLLRRSES